VVDNPQHWYFGKCKQKNLGLKRKIVFSISKIEFLYYLCCQKQLTKKIGYET